MNCALVTTLRNSLKMNCLRATFATHSHALSRCNNPKALIPHSQYLEQAMGNEASRPVGDGLSPHAVAGARVGSSPNMPPTPTFTPTGRRAKSFASFQSPSPSSSGTTTVASSNGNSATSTPAHAQTMQKQQSMPRMERTIQRMDKAIRKRVRGGITYNMKIIIRGEKGTGKTSLFHRLKGEPIPDDHESTPQLQSATINWNFRANSEENVKCEVWDVVDRGFNPLVEGSDAAAADGGGVAEQNGNPFELGALQGNGGNFASVRASAAVAASIAGATGVNGAHTVATVDASTVDVYHETHGAIFLLDVTKWHTLEYVKKELEKVPVHIPTLVLGNFRDCGNQRKIFKEDIQDLLYGGSDRSRQQQQVRRPHELLYFECSLLNCYGLKSLHQYFGIPFLQLKLATIRQQMRIVEGEFSHLKHDLTAKISEQRYSDYVDHIKATGSDIRTGRKVPGTPSGLSRTESSSIVVNGSARNLRIDIEEEQNTSVRVNPERTQSNASTGSDIVISDLSEAANYVDSANGIDSPSELPLPQVEQKDLEDLPERMNSLADQLTAPLKIAHAESTLQNAQEQSSMEATTIEHEREQEESLKKSKKSAKSAPKHSSAAEENVSTAVKGSPVRIAQKGVADEPMNLEDFQVPKQKNNDLDSFYSDEDSDANGDSDEDVVVPPVGGVMKKYASHSHKQLFIHSDSSDSDEEEKTRRKARKNSPRRRVVGAQSAKTPVHEPSRSPSAPEIHAGANPDAMSVGVSVQAASSPAKAAESEPPTKNSHTEHHQPQPPPSPSTTASRSRPVSPLPRTSRSPSPRQKLESSRSHSPRAISQHATPLPSSTGNVAEALTPEDSKDGKAEGDNGVASVEQGLVVEDEVLVNSAPGSSSGRNSPRRHLQHKTSFQSHLSPRTSLEDEKTVVLKEEASETVIPENTDELEVENRADYEVDTTKHDAVSSEMESGEKETVCEEVVPTGEEENFSPRISGDLKYDEEAEHVVLSDDIEDFFSDEEEDHVVPGESVEESTKDEAHEEASAKSSTASLVQNAKRPEMVVSDDDDDPEIVVTPVLETIPDTSSGDLLAENDGIPGKSVPDAQDGICEDGDDVSDLIASSSKESEHFFSDESEGDDEGKQEPKTPLPVSTVRVNLVKPETIQVSRQPDMLMSDEDSDANDARDVQQTRNVSVISQPGNQTQQASTTYLSAPVEARYAPSTPSNDLESFLNESDSESDDIMRSGDARNMSPTSPFRAKASRGPSRPPIVASDDDEEENDTSIERFASYNAKASRKSKAERKQEREEIRRMTASLTATGSPLIEDVTPSATTLGSNATADVMAAIRQAQEEALRMLPPSDGVSDGEDEKKRRHKSRKKSGSSSRSSKTQSEDATSSSTTTKKKSSSSKSSSSRSSKRRDGDSGDERRESRRR